jgi:Xaa-Pro aminopeptidase
VRRGGCRHGLGRRAQRRLRIGTTGTVHVAEPTEECWVHDGVREVQQAGFEAVCPGTDCQQIDRAARAVITEAGDGEYFIHRTGQGIGLTTHEPFIVEGETQAVVVPGMCFSIEPVQAAS